MSKKSAAKAAATAEQAQNPALPLFFSKPAVLDKERHANAGVTTPLDMAFARKTNSLPLNALEFIEAGKSYPIVFTPESAGATMPVAIVGWEQENYFLDRNNKWLDGHYIPAYVRQYPFIFFQPPNGDKFYLCIDEGAPHFMAKKNDKAAAFYEKNGEPSQTSKRALEFCSSFYQHMNLTKNLCADLVKHSLLQPYSSKATLNNGKELQLAGFRMIDEKAFNALPDEVIVEFRKKGWLGFIYLAMASSSNWKRLMDMAAARAAKH